MKTRLLLLLAACLLQGACIQPDARPTADAWVALVGKSLKDPAYAFVENDPKLPNVLIYGDSISIDYTPVVRHELADVANVYRLHRNGEHSGNFVRYMNEMHDAMRDESLRSPWRFEWDVIHFNVGLHDIKYWKDGRRDKVHGTQVSSLEQYEKNLREIIGYLKETAPGARLIFATTTPVPENARGRYVGDAIRYNAVAMEVLADYPEIEINDLYALTRPNQAAWSRQEGNVHFNDEGVAAQGRVVAAMIRDNLPVANLKRDSTTDRPNILLIMSDDQGWGDTGYNGHPDLQTPNLDALRDAGMSFDHFYAAAPVCSPTRASVMTGRHPKRMGIDNPNEGKLRDEEITIAEIAGSLGYVTAHFGKWHLGTMTTDVKDSNRGAPGNIADFGPPWQHGYDIAFATEAKVPTFDPMRDPDNPDEWFGTAYWLGEGDAVPYDDPTLAGDDSRVIVDRLIPFIESQADKEQPFFATVWLHSPHDPVVADPDDPTYADHDGLTDGQKDYYSIVTKLDHEIGRIVRALDDLGIAGDTLVAFTSDNGASDQFAGSNGHFRGYKQDVYEGGIRVPSLLVWPGVIPAGSSSNVPTITHDYMPTLLDIWNAEDRFPADRPLDGRSLMPLVRGEAVPPRQLAFAFTR